MKRIAIATESSANLPPEVAEQNGINVIPLSIVWQDEALADGVEITPQQFYTRLRGDSYMPTTSASTPAQMLEAFERIAQDADEIVAVLLPRELSSSMQAAEVARTSMSRVPVHIVDTRNASMAQGFVALEAARAAHAGATVDEVVARAQQMAGRVQIMAVLETLDYLRRGGRIGSASALMGSMLQIKPIVSIPPGHGSVVGLARPHTWHTAVDRMLTLVDKEVGGRPVHMAVSHGDREQDATELAEELRRRFDVRELYTTWFTPVLGAHVGPVLSISFYAEP